MCKFLSEHKSEGIELLCDLPGLFTGISTVPSDIIITNQRPDLVILNRKDSSITLVELTIPFETNIQQAQERKVARYDTLIQDINDSSNVKAQLITIEIGSRGLISKSNVTKVIKLLKTCGKNQSYSTAIKAFKKDISKITIIASYIIFYSKFDQTWKKLTYIY